MSEYNIHNIVQELKAKNFNTVEERVKYLKQYPNLKKKYKNIYPILIHNNLCDTQIKDVRILNNMLDYAKKIQRGQMSHDEGGLIIGEMVLNEIKN